MMQTETKHGLKVAQLMWGEPSLSVQDAITEYMSNVAIHRAEIFTRTIRQAIADGIFYDLQYRKALHIAITAEGNGEPHYYSSIRWLLNQRAEKRHSRKRGRQKQRDRLDAHHEHQFDKQVERQLDRHF